MGRKRKNVETVVANLETVVTTPETTIPDGVIASEILEADATEILEPGSETEPVLDIEADVVSDLEAAEGDEPEAIDEEPVEEDTRTFLEIASQVDQDRSIAMQHDIGREIAFRFDEAERKGRPTKNLDAAHKKMVTGGVARVLLAAGIEYPSFITRSVQEGEFFNVYALTGKIPDIAKALMGGTMSNAVNIAVIQSMFNLERVGISFDFETAKAAVSRYYPVMREGVRKHLVRHTVKQATASTQAGSTMHALQALGVVASTGGKNPTYTIQDAKITSALRDAVLVAEAED